MTRRELINRWIEVGEVSIRLAALPTLPPSGIEAAYIAYLRHGDAGRWRVEYIAAGAGR